MKDPTQIILNFIHKAVIKKFRFFGEGKPMKNKITKIAKIYINELVHKMENEYLHKISESSDEKRDGKFILLNIFGC